MIVCSLENSNFQKRSSGSQHFYFSPLITANLTAVLLHRSISLNDVTREDLNKADVSNQLNSLKVFQTI